MKVVIADDSGPVVERIAELLREIPGVELVGQAADGRGALLCIQKTNPDMAILDLQMPGGSGLDILRAIRPDHPRLFVLICTNYDYSQYREECLAAGANYFLDKSADFEKIPTILEEVSRNLVKTTPRAR